MYGTCLTNPSVAFTDFRVFVSTGVDSDTEDFRDSLSRTFVVNTFEFLSLITSQSPANIGFCADNISVAEMVTTRARIIDLRGLSGY